MGHWEWADELTAAWHRLNEIGSNIGCPAEVKIVEGEFEIAWTKVANQWQICMGHQGKMRAYNEWPVVYRICMAKYVPALFDEMKKRKAELITQAHEAIRFLEKVTKDYDRIEEAAL